METKEDSGQVREKDVKSVWNNTETNPAGRSKILDWWWFNLPFGQQPKYIVKGLNRGIVMCQSLGKSLTRVDYIDFIKKMFLQSLNLWNIKRRRKNIHQCIHQVSIVGSDVGLTKGFHLVLTPRFTACIYWDFEFRLTPRTERTEIK